MAIRILALSAALAALSVQLPATAEVSDISVEASECTTRDYQAMERRLEDPNVEGTPTFRLTVLETFVSMCPDRIEMPFVARRAARAALDSGDAERALALYQIAIYQGAPFDRAARLDYITALVETGASDRAWALRDQEVARWLEELEQRGIANIDTERLRDGVLHHITFDAVDPNFHQSEVWLAVPFSGGWPAAIVLGADEKRKALRRLVSGDEAVTYQHLDLVRCRGRTTLTQKDSGLASIDVAAIAEETAKSYLRHPDVHYRQLEGDPVGTCYDTHRLFVSPDPRQALSASGVRAY